MARPATYEDLPDYARQGHLIARIPSEYLTRYPSLGVHLLTALAEAERLELDIEDGDIKVPLTTDELDAALDTAQRSWDRAAEWYGAARGGTPIESWKRSTADHWARENGFSPVDWEALDAEGVSAS